MDSFNSMVILLKHSSFRILFQLQELGVGKFTPCGRSYHTFFDSESISKRCFLLIHLHIITTKTWEDFFYWASTILIYTEHQKKLITSSERLLKSTSSKLIIFGHKLALAILIKHILKNKVFLKSKMRKIWWNHKRSVFKNYRNCSPLGLGDCRLQ